MFNYKKISFIFVLSLLIFNLLAIPILVSAQTTTPASVRIKEGITDTGAKAGLVQEGTETELPLIIMRIVKQLLALLGTIFTILIMYGGFLWMTAGGNEEQVGKARKILQNAVIGLLIVALSYAISTFIIGNVQKEVDQIYF